MKERIGGLLAVALGAVLITMGIQSGDSGAVGGLPPTCGLQVVGVAPICPTGVITIDEVTANTPDTPAVATPDAPAAGWKMHLTSTCLDPATSAAVDEHLTVKDNSSATSTPKYVFTDSTSSTSCTYTVVQAAVAGYTTTYDVSSPFSIPFSGGVSNSAITVTVTNTPIAVTTSAAPTTSAPATTAPPTTAPATTASASPSSSSANLADTGPRTRIGTSLYVGVALVLLGGFMLFGGRRRRSGTHS